jgi:hypothetical protein
VLAHAFVAEGCFPSVLPLRIGIQFTPSWWMLLFGGLSRIYHFIWYVVQIALENGYAKIMLGSCASAIACHVLSATVKVYSRCSSDVISSPVGSSQRELRGC